MAGKNSSAQRKRGRKSAQEIEEQVVEALKHLQELGLLEESPLGRLPAVRELAEGKYRLSIFPTAFALRAMLLEAVDAVIRDLGEMPGYQREVKFIRDFVQGRSVAQISRDLGLSREYVARTVQRRALSLVTRAFLAQASQSPMGTPALGSQGTGLTSAPSRSLDK